MRFSIYPPKSQTGEHRSRANALAVACDTTWPEFSAWLAQPLDTDDKHEQGFSPLGAIGPGKGGRKDGGPAAFFVGEFDNAATPALLARALEFFASHSHAAIVYTTASATAECPRFRFVVATSRPIVDDAEYRACVDSIGQALGVQPEDSQRTRLWYRPIRGCRVWTFNGSQGLDVDHAAALYPPAPRGRPRKVDTIAVQSMPVEQRVALAWQALQRRKPEGAFKAGCIAHDYAVPLDQAIELAIRYAGAIGWAFEPDEIASRVEHAFDGYASGELGNALQPPIPARDVADLEHARGLLARELANAPAMGPIAIIAPMGLGKSYAARAFFRQATRAIFVAPTVALVQDTARLLPEAAIYLDDRDRMAPKAITTAQSLHGYGRPNFARVDVVILDEIVETEKQVHAGITNDRRRMMRALVAAIATPRRSLLMGADLTRDDVARYERMCGKPIHVIDLSAHTVIGRRVIETTAERVRHEIEHAATRPAGRIVVFSDRPAELEALRLKLESDHPGMRVLVAHGETDRGVVAGLHGGAWDVLLATHAMASGVSIDVPVAHLFVLRSSNMRGDVPPELVAQQIGRCRDYQGGPVLVGTPKWEADSRTTSAVQLLLEAAQAVASTGAPYRPEPIDGVLVDSFAAVLAKADAAHNHPWLDEVCRAAGWAWEQDTHPFERPKHDRDRDRTFAQIEREHYVQRVRAADPGSVDERRARTAEHFAALDHAELLDHFGPEAEITDEDILMNRGTDGRHVRALRACAHVLDEELAAHVGRAADTGRDLTARTNARAVAQWRAFLYRWVTGAHVGQDAIASAVVVAAKVRELCGFVSGGANDRVPHIGRKPRAGREVEWLRRQLGAFGVTMTKEGDRLSLAWPTARELAHYQATAKLMSGPPRRRGRRSPLAQWAIEAAVQEHGSQRAAARALGVGETSIRRALNRMEKDDTASEVRR